MKRAIWQIVWILVATVASLYLTYLVSRYYGYGPTAYEPKDFERQQLYDRTGRSVLDPPPAATGSEP
jgi:hypothetical protein